MLEIPTTQPAAPALPQFDPTNPAHLAATALGILGGDNYIANAENAATAAGDPAHQATQGSTMAYTGQLGDDMQVGADPNKDITLPGDSSAHPAQESTDEALRKGKWAPEVPLPATEASTGEAAQGGPGGAVKMGGPMTGTWATDVLNAAGLPVSSENIRAMEAWQQAEGGGGKDGGTGGSKTDFNWLNTNRPMAGSRSVNSVNIQAYASYSDGIMATVGALLNGNYGDVISALRQGDNADAVARAVGASHWGTPADSILNILHRTPVGGSGGGGGGHRT